MTKENVSYTKGPWKAVFPEQLLGDRHWQIRSSDDRFTPAMCLGKGAEANARLIACAPDLLEALKEAGAYLEIEYERTGSKTAKLLAEAYLALISRTEGKE